MESHTETEITNPDARATKKGEWNHERMVVQSLLFARFNSKQTLELFPQHHSNEQCNTDEGKFSIHTEFYH